jgi:hypothetical protein
LLPTPDLFHKEEEKWTAASQKRAVPRANEGNVPS